MTFYHSDRGEHCILVLLEVNAGFNTIDHSPSSISLLHMLASQVLEYFSYLSNRRSFVSMGFYMSSSAALSYGVPQGSHPLSHPVFSAYASPGPDCMLNWMYAMKNFQQPIIIGTDDKNLVLLSVFEQFGPVQFGESRRATRLHFILIHVS